MFVYEETLFLIALYSFAIFVLPKEKKKSVENVPAAKTWAIQKNLSDSALLDTVQKQTFRYFWDFAHPVSGMARERSNVTDYGPEDNNDWGFRFWNYGNYCCCRTKMDIKRYCSKPLLKWIRFLRKADVFHGAYPHWMNGETGKVIRFSPKRRWW